MSLSRNIAQKIVEKNIPIEDIVAALLKYKLVSLLPSIKKAVDQMYRDEGSKETIAVESPFPLDERALAQIRRIAGNDLAPMTTTINKNILAGFKARYRGKLYDGSAERIMKQLIGNPSSHKATTGHVADPPSLKLRRDM